MDEIEQSGFKVEKMIWGGISAGTFQIMLRKNKELPKQQYIDAINFEFNLPLPNGRRYGRQKEVLEVLGLYED